MAYSLLLMRDEKLSHQAVKDEIMFLTGRRIGEKR